MRLSLVISTIIATTLGHTALADRTVLHSLWQDGDTEAIHTGLLSRDQFETQGEALIARGFRLIDIETAVSNGRRGFAGLFTQGTGGNFFAVGLSLRDMRARMEEMRARNLRMLDIEAYPRNGRTRYAAVFGPGRGEEALVRPLAFDDFLERKEVMRTLDMRLIDVEPVAVAGRVRFVGLYASRGEPAVVTGFRPRPRFVELRDRMVSDGWEMVDFERFVNAQGNDVYLGLWREGDGPSRLSRFRTPGQQLLFTAQQRQAGRMPVDMELKIRQGDGDTPPTPLPPQASIDLPDNPPNVTVTGGSGTPQFVIDFQTADDMPIPVTIPAQWLPSWLPAQDGEVFVPDGHCGFNIRHADRISWQVPGNPDLTTEVFRSGPVTETVDRFGGISFSGPVGACAGTNLPWIFNPPFTAQRQVVLPVPNMRLVIEGAGAELRFQPHDGPVEEVFGPFELFKGESEGRLKEVLETFDALAEDGAEPLDYCPVVGAFWTAVCAATQSGDVCPLPKPNLPECQVD